LDENPNQDTVIYGYLMKNDESKTSLVQSSVTNSLGGWTIDKSNFRYEDGSLVDDMVSDQDFLIVHPQYEDLVPEFGSSLVIGVDDIPAPDFTGNYKGEEGQLGNVLSRIDTILFSIRDMVTTSSFAAITCLPGDEDWCNPDVMPKPPS